MAVRKSGAGRALRLLQPLHVYMRQNRAVNEDNLKNK